MTQLTFETSLLYIDGVTLGKPQIKLFFSGRPLRKKNEALKKNSNKNVATKLEIGPQNKELFLRLPLIKPNVQKYNTIRKVMTPK